MGTMRGACEVPSRFCGRAECASDGQPRPVCGGAIPADQNALFHHVVGAFGFSGCLGSGRATHTSPTHGQDVRPADPTTQWISLIRVRRLDRRLRVP